MKKHLFIRFLILFPGVGIFYFCLMAIGDYSIVGFKLDKLRLFGPPNLANLIEIPIAAGIGLISAKTISSYEFIKNKSLLFIITIYVLIILMYFLFPNL